MLFPFCDETLWLVHEDGLFEFAIQEGRLDINLMYLEIVCSSKREEKTNGVSLGNWRKRLGKIDARFLCKALGNQSSFVAGDLTGRRSLDMEDPLAANWFAIMRRWD